MPTFPDIYAHYLPSWQRQTANAFAAMEKRR